MTLDYAALFAATPSPYLVLDTRFVIVDVNHAYLLATLRTREELLGQYVFDAFPDNPADSEADGVPNLEASLHRVLTSRKPDSLALQRYDIPLTETPGLFEERWWSTINTPVLKPDGTVAWIIHRVEDVTAFIHARHPGVARGARVEGMEAELYARARELQRLNEELRLAHARERHVALALQEAMLHAPDLNKHQDIAVRYLPAVGSLNVCGDWFDIVDLPDGSFAVAVGDVVGHGLQAATVMGMLRSALSAAARAVEGPATALEVLGLYARSVDGALAATAALVLIDTGRRLITYSSAGHPPPILLYPDGACELLDQATDPPLGARPVHAPPPQAVRAYIPDTVLVLYTDGLIERRGEDIDVGLPRLTDALTRHRRLGPGRLADAVLAQLDVSGGARDDIALVIVRL
ncbi:PP2C family protein-serine/threonine phosphatase [Streptomyces lunaelactis]|uniref:PP2C family protein-serine/threonine phosphatase n=1 Tax=Streptomyces lunaelactis TaxID=1535768 RepID=UPI00158562D8|nr:SpoIIE family protein phosphatase [Streptomyces lunaelactis]NUL24831.1 SpoIIE family protein phosphatase [Streptomyces lunaelactis]